MGKKKGGGGGDGGGGGCEKKKQEVQESNIENGEKIEEKKHKGGGNGGGGGKKEEGPLTVVLKVDMHCYGCTKKIEKSVKGFPGVEGVMVDATGGKLTVVGRVDPWKIRDRVAEKTRKDVQLVSPANYPRKETPPPTTKKQQDNKSKQPVVTTATLKMQLHCRGCIERIQKTLKKVKGVEQVSFDEGKELVTVTGTMDTKLLPSALKSKMKREAVIVQPKKEGDKKGGEGGGGGEKKENVGGGGEKKENAGGGGEKKKSGGGAPDPPAAAAAAEAALVDYYYSLHAPQLFSDENPNACAIL